MHNTTDSIRWQNTHTYRIQFFYSFYVTWKHRMWINVPGVNQKWVAGGGSCNSKWTDTVIMQCAFKPGFHYPSSRPEFTGRVDGPWTRVHFLTPELTARVSTNAPELTGCQLGCIFWTRAVNSGSGNRALATLRLNFDRFHSETNCILCNNDYDDDDDDDSDIAANCSYYHHAVGTVDSCNSVNGTLSNGAPCPQSNWLVYVLSALYLLISNILLLNILIAIFKYVRVRIVLVVAAAVYLHKIMSVMQHQAVLWIEAIRLLCCFVIISSSSTFGVAMITNFPLLILNST